MTPSKLLCVSVCACACLCVAFVSPGFAQMSQEELRRERQETYEELRKTQDMSGSSNFIWRGLSNATGWELDYGGYYAPTFTSGDNGTDHSKATPDALDHTWEHDLRMFLRVNSASKKTKFYARVKTTSTHNSQGNSAAAIDRSDWAQPTFDMLYMELPRVGRTFKHTWTIGRQYAQVERGISYGLVADGVRYEMASRKNELQFFFMRQQPGDDNVDGSATGWSTGRTKRWFYAAEWKWKFIGRQTLDLSMLGNIDRNFDHIDGTGQKHQLDSVYYGLGLGGGITSRWSYWTQYIMETGKTYQSGGATKINVDASAINLGTRYFFPTTLSPTVYAEYAAGSGDNDATGSATSTAGGSTAGKDKRFISFGGMSLGYALAPTLNNIKVIKFGGSVKPFGWSASRLWSELLFQPTFYSYKRDQAAGAISDPTAAVANSDLGSEIDMTIAWRLSSDLKYQFKWGRFSPGAAYTAATRASETYWRLKISLDL